MAFPLFGRGPNRPVDLLPRGWQLYSRPTNLEPIGTIFRIDQEGRRFIVNNLTPATRRADVSGHAEVEHIETTSDAIARLLGLPSLKPPVGVRAARPVRFHVVEPMRHTTTEAVLDDALTPYVAAMEFRKDSRYYVIRETRSAAAITFLLSLQELDEIGGEAAVAAAGDRRVTITAGRPGVFDLTYTLEEPKGVMFLAEEIAPIVAGLAGDEAKLGRVAVEGAVDWVDPNYTVVRVFFATDRAMTDGALPRELFGTDRSELRYGECAVSIPRDHRMGDLEAPSTVRLEFREDPAKHVVLLTATVRPHAEFFAELAARVQQSEAPSAFVFVHGFNVTFEDAAQRTAQIAYDLAFDGAPVFYSWPSKESKLSYRDDEKTIAWAQTNLQRFLTDVFEQSQAQKIVLIAHSMGNRAMTHAVATLLADRPDLRPRLYELILTAPDIDAEVFTRDIVPALVKAGCPITLYASSKDLALVASKAINGAARAGDAGPGLVVARGIETIDATEVDTSFVGHSYFAEARSVLADLFYLVREGFRADRRFGLRAMNIDRGRYWIFKP